MCFHEIFWSIIPLTLPPWKMARLNPCRLNSCFFLPCLWTVGSSVILRVASSTDPGSSSPSTMSSTQQQSHWQKSWHNDIFTMEIWHASLSRSRKALAPLHSPNWHFPSNIKFAGMSNSRAIYTILRLCITGNNICTRVKLTSKTRNLSWTRISSYLESSICDSSKICWVRVCTFPVCLIHLPRWWSFRAARPTIWWSRSRKVKAKKISIVRATPTISWGRTQIAWLFIIITQAFPLNTLHQCTLRNSFPSTKLPEEERIFLILPLW